MLGVVCVCVCVCARTCACAQSVVSDSFVTPWTIGCQASLSMEFSRQEYWNWLSFPSPRDHPEPGTQPMSLVSPAMAGRFFTTVPHGKSSTLGSPSVTATWSPDWEKALGSVSTPWVRLQIAELGAPTYNPKLQTDIISLCAKMQLWFY